MIFTLTPLMQVHQLPVYIANHSAASFLGAVYDLKGVNRKKPKKTALGGLTNSFRLS